MFVLLVGVQELPVLHELLDELKTFSIIEDDAFLFVVEDVIDVHFLVYRQDSLAIEHVQFLVKVPADVAVSLAIEHLAAFALAEVQN